MRNGSNPPGPSLLRIYRGVRRHRSRPPAGSGASTSCSRNTSASQRSFRSAPGLNSARRDRTSAQSRRTPRKGLSPAGHRRRNRPQPPRPRQNPRCRRCRSHSPFANRRYQERPAISSSLPSPSTSATANDCSLTPVTIGRKPGPRGHIRIVRQRDLEERLGVLVPDIQLLPPSPSMFRHHHVVGAGRREGTHLAALHL